ncbi:6-bladed beta-propeller [Salinibacter sp. 10B]|uniref:6-bladed beta-propeller n=1 Tax=Salinibacter sp. 10B TaxID=1923971 RepID=UPI0011B07AEF|nr:6-bladed beta-propeller [Salinibacter sp. 10B]
MSVNRFALSFLCMLGLLLGGCGDSDESSYGEWTVAEDSLRLTEDLRLSETEDFYFGSITTLDVTSEGRMVVADRAASNIKVLRPDGTLLDTLGGPGEGPGEFQMLTRIGVDARDSLYALDLRRRRITVYAPEAPYERSRTFTVPPGQGFMALLYVLPNGLAGSFGSSMSPEDGVTRPAPSAVRPLDTSGTPGDTLFLDRSRRMAFVFGENGGFTTDVVPFSRETIVAPGPNGRLYSGWTDSLHIQTHTLDGESEVVASIPTEPVPVTEAARDSALSDLDEKVRSMAASALPDTKPAFTQLLVAENGRLWIKRPTKAPDPETVPWWVLNPETQTIHKTQLPSTVTLTVVTDDYAYGTTQTNLGAPAVVRYRIES